MPKHNASPTPLHDQPFLKKPEDIGSEGGWWHMHEQNESSQLDGNLSGFEKAFLDEMDKKDPEIKDEEAEKDDPTEIEMLQKTHENTITDIRARLGTQIKDLTAERQELQTMVNSHDKLLVNFRRKYTTEIKTLIEMKERLENEVNTKLKEAAIVHDMYGVQIRRLIDEMAVLQSKLNKLTVGAVAMDVEVPRNDEAAVTEKSAAPIPQPSKAKSQRVARCTQCMSHNWECDLGILCKNCSLRGIRPGCKRVMCKRYKKNACQDGQCRFSHEGDRYNRITPYEEVWGDGREISPVELESLGPW